MYNKTNVIGRGGLGQHFRPGIAHSSRPSHTPTTNSETWTTLLAYLYQVQVKASQVLLSFRYMWVHTVERNVVPHRTINTGIQQ